MPFGNGGNHVDINRLQGLMGEDPCVVKSFRRGAVAGCQQSSVGAIKHKHRRLKRLEMIQELVDPFETEIHANDAYQIPFFVS